MRRPSDVVHYLSSMDVAKDAQRKIMVEANNSNKGVY